MRMLWHVDEKMFQGLEPVYPSTIRIWNQLPECTVSAPSLETLKTLIKDCIALCYRPLQYILINLIHIYIHWHLYIYG